MLLTLILSLVALAAVAFAGILFWLQKRERDEAALTSWSPTAGERRLRLMRPMCRAHIRVLELLGREAPGLKVLSIVPLFRVMQKPGKLSSLLNPSLTLPHSLCLDFVICSDNGSVRAIIDLVGGPGLEHRSSSVSNQAVRGVMRDLLGQAGTEVVCWDADFLPPAAEVREFLKGINISHRVAS